MEKWVNFYRPFFPDQAATEAWVMACEALVAPNNHAMIMMHQAQRLITIGDRVPEIQPHAEPLQLMFYIICAEHLSKLHDKFEGEGHSKAYVLRFFTNFVVGNDRTAVDFAFTDHTDRFMPPVPFEKTVALLYAIRCDVVHEGKYWDFAFHDGETSMLNVDPDVTVNITLASLRDIIVRGAIRAVSERLADP